jgi:hypothetical protein
MQAAMDHVQWLYNSALHELPDEQARPHVSTTMAPTSRSAAESLVARLVSLIDDAVNQNAISDAEGMLLVSKCCEPLTELIVSMSMEETTTLSTQFDECSTTELHNRIVEMAQCVSNATDDASHMVLLAVIRKSCK